MPNSEYVKFIRENSTPIRPALLPELVLWTAHESLPLWTRAQEWIASAEIPLPFWAFPWAGGQALARYVLDYPHRVQGKTVLDFGSGSGLVAIAASKAGAARVLACDIDPFARAAIALNADLNEVELEIPTFDVMLELPPNVDVVLAGDVFYEREPALRFIAWFRRLRQQDVQVYVGDPGRHYVPKDELEEVETYTVPTTRELEDFDSRATTVFRMK